MAQRLTLRKSFFCALMFLVFPHTGISNESIFISHSKEDTDDVLTCVLSENVTVIQTSWERGVAPNKTQLGMFHPLHGTHVPSRFNGQVEIQSSTPYETSLILKNGVMSGNESSILCCVFITFPLGSLDHCIDMSKINSTQVLTQDKQTGDDERLLRSHTLLAGGSLLSLLIFSMFAFIFCRKNFRRTKVSEIQTANITDPQPTHSEQAHSESTPQINTTNPTDTSLGFDPSKLYAKIKKDLLYGRLWKSYQGKPQTWTPRPREPTRTRSLPTPRKIYFVLGEHFPPQTQEQETKNTDANTPLSD